MPLQVRIAIECFATIAAHEFHLLQMDLTDVCFQNVDVRKCFVTIFADVHGGFLLFDLVMLIVMDTQRSNGEETGLVAHETFVRGAFNVFLRHTFIAQAMMFELAVANESLFTRWTFVCSEMTIDVRITLFSCCEFPMTHITRVLQFFEGMNFQDDFAGAGIGDGVFFVYLLVLYVIDVFGSVGVIACIKIWYGPNIELLAHVECEHMIRKMSVTYDMASCNALHIQIDCIAPCLSTSIQRN